jgi:cardiolipin synthase
MPDWLTPPNLITAARIFLTPFIGIAVAADDFRSAFTLLLIAALSDGIDGWLARRFNWRTRTGELLDPIADKLLAATIFIGLGVSHAIPRWMVALVLGRDIAILMFAAWALAFRGIRSFPPSVWGKISTFFQFAAATGAVLERVWPSFFLLSLYPPVFWAAVAATSWSAIHYFLVARRLLLQISPDGCAGRVSEPRPSRSGRRENHSRESAGTSRQYPD